MQSLFLTPPHIESPRWQQAFPSALVIHDEQKCPADLHGWLVWIVMGDAFTLAHIARWVAAGARVVGLTQMEDPQQAKQVLEAGASGYLHYLAVAPVLRQVSQVVELGGLWLGVDLMRQLVSATSAIFQPLPETASLNLLSVREQDVAKAVAAGKSNKEVAKELGITERTVKAHLSAIFEKLNVRDRLHLVLVLSGR